MWNQVINCVEPRMTRALLAQQCHLISLNESLAIVGIGNSRLQSLHQGKVTNIEAAFAKICQRKIKVSLEVAKLDEPPPKESVTSKESIPTFPSPQSLPQLQKESAIPATNNKSVESETTKKKIDNSSHAVNNRSELATNDLQENNNIKNTFTSTTPTKVLVKSAIASDNAITTAFVTTTAPEIENNTEATDKTSELLSETNYGEDDLQQAIEELTVNFEGEVVQLDDRVRESLQVERASDIDFSATSEENKIADKLPPTPRIKLGNRPDFDEYDDDF